MKTRVLLTGATGALGSMLLRRLCDQGYEVVCLVRAKDPGEALKRVREASEGREHVKAVVGDITKPLCGISATDRQLLAGAIERIIHCAASVNLLSKTDAERTNVAGVAHVLELAGVLDVRNLVHVSTAYVFGDAPYVPEGGLPLGQTWKNSYEESKFVGEEMVRTWGRENGERRFTIFRPSILVGCEDGTTLTLDGFYSYFEPLHRAAQMLRSRNGEGLPPGVAISADGCVHVPLAVIVGDTRINFVPIDWAADMMVAALQLPACNETLHFVHDRPLRLREGLGWSLDHLKIDGLAICRTQDEKEIAVSRQTPFVRRLQRRIDAVHKAYVPYCTMEPEFEMEALRRGLGATFRSAPPIDQAFIVRMLSYARERFWQSG